MTSGFEAVAERAGPAIYRAFSGLFLYRLALRGPVAQGIEQQPSKLKVAGLNPSGVAIKSGPLQLWPRKPPWELAAGHPWEAQKEEKFNMTGGDN